MKKITKITITAIVLIVLLIVLPTFTFDDTFTTLPLIMFLGFRNYITLASVVIVLSVAIMWYLLDGNGIKEKFKNAKDNVNLYNKCKVYKGEKRKKCLERR